MTSTAVAKAEQFFRRRPSVTVSYLRVDGCFTVWLPQDKRTWRIDDKYGQPVCGPNGRPLRFMSSGAAMIAAEKM